MNTGRSCNHHLHRVCGLCVNKETRERTDTYIELGEEGSVEVQGFGQGQHSGGFIVALCQNEISTQRAIREQISPLDGRDHTHAAAPAQHAHSQQVASLHGRAGTEGREVQLDSGKKEGELSAPPLHRAADTLQGARGREAAAETRSDWPART